MVTTVIGRFRTHLEKTVPVFELFLYGSHAKQKATVWSDIDIVVVSSSFEGLNHRARKHLVNAAKVQAEAWSIQAHVLSVTEWANPPSPFSRKIKTYAIKLTQ